MFRKIMITGFALFLLAACGTDTSTENGSTTDESTTANEANTANNTNAVENTNGSTSNNTSTVVITNPTVSMNEAVDIFKQAYPNVKIESVDLDSDFGRLRYDIDGFDETKQYEVEIDATTKEIIVNEVEKQRDTDEALDFSAIIDPAKAIETASTKSEVEGLSPTGWSLEVENGKQIYTIEYEKNNSDIDVKIDATTGEILKVETDD